MHPPAPPPMQRKSTLGSSASSTISTVSGRGGIGSGSGQMLGRLQSLAPTNGNQRRTPRATVPLEKVVVQFLGGQTVTKWSPTTDQATARKWRSINGSFDIFDRLMVRAEKSPGGSLGMGRQLSLDSTQRPQLRRQISEDLKHPPPGPLKIAWTSTDQLESPSVEVVAKKCGQPKPSMVKPPRSPFLADENAAVLYSRQQLTERLRTSWKKTSGRHNLNIFLNQSLESEQDSVSDVVDSPKTRTPSTTEDESEPDEDQVDHTSQETVLKDKTSASDRRQAFRAMGRQSKISAVDSPCPTPEPFSKEQGARPGAGRRMMSAPSRPQVKKLTKSATVESRIKSAPPKRKHKPQMPRRRGKGDSSDEEKSGGTRRVKRGVDKGEIVTMVSLVSPAESEDEEPTPAIQLPATPKPPSSPNRSSESPRPNPPPPPPILTLRKPAKTVTFRPVIAPTPSSTQFQTSFPLKRTLVHQNTIGSLPQSNGFKSPSSARSPLQRQTTLPSPSTSSTPEPAPVSASPRPPSALKQTPKVVDCIFDDGALQTIPSVDETAIDVSDSFTNFTQTNDRPPPKVQRKTLSFVGRPPNPAATTARRKFIQTTHSVIKIEPEPIKEVELPPPLQIELPSRQDSEDVYAENKDQEAHSEQIFKNSKEKECYQLFKKMSDRGVSVSFETVLRGLLTPTEYRMRRSALLSVC